MWNLRACAVCLSTGGKLLDMDSKEQREDFNSVACLNSNGCDGLLSYLCVECSAYVRRFKKFQTKCQRANKLLQEMFNEKEQINHLDISSINREKLDFLPSLGYWKTDSCHYEEIEFKWVENYETNIIPCSNVPIFSISITGNYDFTLKRELESGEHLDNDKEDIKTEPADNSQSVPNYIEIEVTKIDNNKRNIDKVSFSDEDGYQDDVVNCARDTVEAAPAELAAGAGGSTLDLQYADFYPLSDNQQKVVAEITKLFSIGPYKCSTCNKGYYVEKNLEEHSMKYHQKYVNGLFFCKFCIYYFKSEHLFQSHMSNTHLYKYVCTKCTEVNFDRLSAKSHYIRIHLQGGPRRHVTWHDVKRGWITCGKRVTAVSTNKDNKKKVDSSMPVNTKINLTDIFFARTPLRHLEQYELINDRQKSKNYTESKYKCELCFRGFRGVATFNNHLKKHDPKYSGSVMCDVCKLHFKNTKKLYSHIAATHLFRYNCQKCQFVCYNSCKTHTHYRWHKKVIYSCTHCGKQFTKQTTQLSHIRIKHPSTNICNICGHSFVNDTGLNYHIRILHSKEEIELSERLSRQVSQEGELYCGDCKIHFASDKAFKTHLGSSNKHATVNLSVQNPWKKGKAGRLPSSSSPLTATLTKDFTPIDCEKCGKHLTNKVKARQHYNVVHPGTDMLHLCDICGFPAKTYLNLISHIRTHTKEKPFACNFCDKRFSLAYNRDRHDLIHTGEKPHECSHCHRRFAQRSSMKLHIQTVHLKIPYPPWNKKNRKRRSKPELSDSPSKSKVCVEKQGVYLDAFISYQDEEV